MYKKKELFALSDCKFRIVTQSGFRGVMEFLV